MQIKRDTVFLCLVLLFISTLFFPSFIVYNAVITGLLVLFALLNGSFREKLLLLRERKYTWWMLGFVVMIFISLFLSDDHKRGLSSLDPRLPLLYFPLSIGLLQLDRETRNKILFGIAIIVTVACFACLAWSGYQYIQTNNAALLYNDSLTSLIGQQSIYISFLVNLSIYIFGYFIFYTRLPPSYKLLLVIAVAFLFIISYMLASRNMMLLLYAITLIFLFYFILERKRYLEGFTLLMGLVMAGFLIFKFFPKTINRFKELSFTSFDYQHQGKESHYNMKVTADQWNGANFRLAAWPCGWQLFKEHPVFGVGLGDKKEELFKVYQQKGFHFAIDTKKNVHNNYLDILFSMGISGFILFVTGWIILPFIRCVRYSDGLAFLIIFTIALAMLTENYFDRSLGGMLVGFFIPFLLAGSKKQPAGT